MATKVTSSLINTISASQIQAGGATTGQVLTYNGSTSTWVASAAPMGVPGGNIQAWVRFDGVQNTGTLPNSAINKSYNISSVEKVQTGVYTINFTNSMSDGNYLILGTSRCVVGSGTTVVSVVSATTTFARIGVTNLTNVVQDINVINVGIIA